MKGFSLSRNDFKILNDEKLTINKLPKEHALCNRINIMEKLPSIRHRIHITPNNFKLIGVNQIINDWGGLINGESYINAVNSVCNTLIKEHVFNNDNDRIAWLNSAYTQAAIYDQTNGDKLESEISKDINDSVIITGTNLDLDYFILNSSNYNSLEDEMENNMNTPLDWALMSILFGLQAYYCYNIEKNCSNIL